MQIVPLIQSRAHKCPAANELRQFTMPLGWFLPQRDAKRSGN